MKGDWVNNFSAGFGIERTPRGGIHAAVSQLGAHVATQRAGIKLPDVVQSSHLRTFPSRSFYFSLWSRITRPALAEVPLSMIANVTFPLNNTAYKFWSGY